jgi:4-azaleucine resistance transporter AzlC
MTSGRSEFFKGVRAESPILVGVVPFGLIYGVSAVSAGLSPLAAQAMSFIVLAGSAQIVMTRLIGAGAPPLVTIVTALMINLRHILYSASLSPYVRHLSPLWRWFLAYLLIDESYAVAISRYHREGVNPQAHWYFVGAGAALWVSWQVSTALGIVLGASIPPGWSLDFAVALSFIALVVPMLRDRASVVAALVASVVAVVAFGLPYKLDLLVATLVGMGVGLVVLWRRPGTGA